MKTLHAQLMAYIIGRGCSPSVRPNSPPYSIHGHTNLTYQGQFTNTSPLTALTNRPRMHPIA